MRRVIQLTVWHDRGCPPCRREIALMRRLDRHAAIRFVGAATAGADACPTDQRDLLARFHARDADTLLSGAAAFAATWRAILSPRPLGLPAWSPIILRVLDTACLAFLKARAALQHVARRAASA